MPPELQMLQKNGDDMAEAEPQSTSQNSNNHAFLKNSVPFLD